MMFSNNVSNLEMYMGKYIFLIFEYIYMYIYILKLFFVTYRNGVFTYHFYF